MTEDYRNWDEDLVDDVPTVQMGPGTHDDRLAEAADQLAGLLEFTFGHGVWEDAREVAYTALESCRTALRGAIVGARAAAVEVQARGWMAWRSCGRAWKPTCRTELTTPPKCGSA